MKNFLRYLGRLKYRATRLFPYLTILNTIQLFRLNTFEWWYLIFIVAVIAAYLFEKEHGITGELDVSWSKSNEWQNFKVISNERFDEINAKLDKLAQR